MRYCEEVLGLSALLSAEPGALDGCESRDPQHGFHRPKVRRNSPKSGRQVTPNAQGRRKADMLRPKRSQDRKEISQKPCFAAQRITVQTQHGSDHRMTHQAELVEAIEQIITLFSLRKIRPDHPSARQSYRIAKKRVRRLTPHSRLNLFEDLGVSQESSRTLLRGPRIEQC